jgi:hypothetical protein
MLLLLNHWPPDRVIKSVEHCQDHIDQGICSLRDELLEVLKTNGLLCRFIATDDDNGVEQSQRAAFEKYSKLGVMDIRAILRTLTDNGTKDLEHWSASDPFHRLKNTCSRDALVTLALGDMTDGTVTSEPLTRNMRKGEKHAFMSRKPPDLVRDDLPIQSFTLEHLLCVWTGPQPVEHAVPCALEEDEDPDEVSGSEFDPDSEISPTPDPTGGYFLLPLVAMNLAIRNPGLGVAARLNLIQLAFSVFFGYLKHYPNGKKLFGIAETGEGDLARKTLWTRAAEHAILASGSGSNQTFCWSKGALIPIGIFAFLIV